MLPHLVYLVLGIEPRASYTLGSPLPTQWWSCALVLVFLHMANTVVELVWKPQLYRSFVCVVAYFSWQTAKVVSWWESIWLAPRSCFLESLKGFLWLRCQLLVWATQYSSDLFFKEANRSCRTGRPWLLPIGIGDTFLTQVWRTGRPWLFPIGVGDTFLTQVSLMSSALTVAIGFVDFSVVSFEPHSISRKWLE